MAMMECKNCHRIADSRCFRSCVDCGAPLCDDCANAASGLCGDCEDRGEDTGCRVGASPRRW